MVSAQESRRICVVKHTFLEVADDQLIGEQAFFRRRAYTDTELICVSKSPGDVASDPSTTGSDAGSVHETESEADDMEILEISSVDSDFDHLPSQCDVESSPRARASSNSSTASCGTKNSMAVSAAPSSPVLLLSASPASPVLMPLPVPMWGITQPAGQVSQQTMTFPSAPSRPLSAKAGKLWQDESAAAERTTLMFRNLPNLYTRDMLCEMLDSEGFRGRYNFLYLPIDFKSSVGFGYAFVNFVSHEDAETAKQFFQGFMRWKVQSRKALEMDWSGPQGLQVHVERYRNSPVMHDQVPQEFKPILLKNGQRVQFPPPTKRIRPMHARK